MSKSEAMESMTFMIPSMTEADAELEALHLTPDFPQPF
jgi:hypothetical protein